MALVQSRAAVRDLIDGSGASAFATDEDWDQVRDTVYTWFFDLKGWESDDTWEDAFKESRMTMRAILESRQTGYYSEKVPIKGREDEGGVRTIKTMQGVPGIEERMREQNFWPQLPSLRTLRYDKGLHDVSAVLLDPKRSLKIGGDEESLNQIYRATGDTTYVFMPVPSEADHEVFHQLNEISKKPQTVSWACKFGVRLMRSRLTRIKVAFEDDGGCKFVDLSPEGDAYLPKFRYGHTAMKKVSAFKKVRMSEEEIAERRAAARKYKSVLLGKNRNEIVIAYRQHGLKSAPSRFPMFAKHVFDGDKHTHYKVIDRNGTATGRIITLRGELR